MKGYDKVSVEGALVVRVEDDFSHQHILRPLLHGFLKTLDPSTMIVNRISGIA